MDCQARYSRAARLANRLRPYVIIRARGYRTLSPHVFDAASEGNDLVLAPEDGIG
jgi:hypothetical protein